MAGNQSTTSTDREAIHIPPTTPLVSPRGGSGGAPQERRMSFFLSHSPLFQKLKGVENELDVLYNTRMALLQESSPPPVGLGLPSHTTRKLRLSIYNTYSNITPTYCTTEQDRIHRLTEPSSWSLKIQGQLLPPTEPTKPKTLQHPSHPPKFSSFFKSIIVQLDPNQYPTDWLIEWNKNQALHGPTTDLDGFEIKRIGNRDTFVHIFLLLDSYGKYKIRTPLLAQELGLSQPSSAGAAAAQTQTQQVANQVLYSKTQVILSLWNYIRNHKLQDPSNPNQINCNNAFNQIFGKSTFTSTDIPQLILDHLSPPDPIQLFYNIRTQGTVLEQQYLITVELPPSPPLTAPNHKEIEKLDEKINQLLCNFSEHQLNRRLLLDLSVNPLKVIQQHLNEQVRDYQTNQYGRDFEAERRTLFYLNHHLDDVLPDYLDNQTEKKIKKMNE